MNRIFNMIIAFFLCFSLTSCTALEHSISGEIIDPVDGFSRSEKKGTLVYKDSNYICVQEINGDCEIEIIKEDILLGYTSNFPFFSDSYYYANASEDPEFIMSGVTSSMIGGVVFLREDLYSNGVIYALENDPFEFEFASAFIKTSKVDYDIHIKEKKYTEVATVNFHMKDIPRIKASKNIYLIENTWYCVETDTAYQLSEEFVCILRENWVIH